MIVVQTTPRRAVDWGIARVRCDTFKLKVEGRGVGAVGFCVAVIIVADFDRRGNGSKPNKVEI